MASATFSQATRLPIVFDECSDCGWAGPFQAEDRCPSCGRGGSMTSHSAARCCFPATANPRLGEMPCAMHADAYRTSDMLDVAARDDYARRRGDPRDAR